MLLKVRKWSWTVISPAKNYQNSLKRVLLRRKKLQWSYLIWPMHPVYARLSTWAASTWWAFGLTGGNPPCIFYFHFLYPDFMADRYDDDDDDNCCKCSFRRASRTYDWYVLHVVVSKKTHNVQSVNWSRVIVVMVEWAALTYNWYVSGLDVYCAQYWPAAACQRLACTAVCNRRMTAAY